MAFSLRGAMHGLGGAMENAGLLALKETLEEQRQTRLMELTQAFQASESEKQRTLTREEGAAGRSVTREEGAATRSTQEKLSTDTRASIEREGAETRKHQTTENAATRVVQVQLAELHEKAASARDGASLALQRAQLEATLNQVKLVPQGDGTFVKVRSDGTNMGVLVDPLTEKPVQGPKDIGAATKLLVEGNNKIIEGLEKAAATESDNKSKAELISRAETIRQENKKLLGMTVEKPRATIVDPFKKAGPEKPATTPAAPSGPGGVNSVLTSQDQARIQAAKSPVERTRIRQGLIRERMQELDAKREIEGAEEEDRLRALGIDPASAAFSVR